MSDQDVRTMKEAVDFIDKKDIYGDGIGYVALVEGMGDEFTPAEDARMSTGKGRLGAEKDSKLQARLLKDNHTSPFEGVILKFEMAVPLFVLREMDRHRTLTKVADDETKGWGPPPQTHVETVVPEESGRKWFARNEMSGRYIQLPNHYYFPAQLRYQDKKNNQGGVAGPIGSFDRSLHEKFIERGRQICAIAREHYDWAVLNNIEKGQARIFNTQNQYTRIRMTGSLKNWLDFLSLRLTEGVVLWECREVALAIKDILERLFPSVVKEWNDSVYDTVRITRKEAETLKPLIRLLTEGGSDSAYSLALKPILEKLK